MGEKREKKKLHFLGVVLTVVIAGVIVVVGWSSWLHVFVGMYAYMFVFLGGLLYVHNRTLLITATVRVVYRIRAKSHVTPVLCLHRHPRLLLYVCFTLR